MKSSEKLTALESLRGLLAVWVVGAHVAGRSLLDSQIRSAHLAALTEPLLPVYVFMILSGFVIFYLLNREEPDYRAFLIRRLFRLVPLYFAVLALVAPLVQTQLHALESLPARNHTILDSIRIHEETLAWFWSHLTAHVFLLHGLIPEAWLRDTNFAFLSQGWSISLEWQFYLLAPLVFLLIQKRRIWALALIALACAVLQFAQVAGIGFLPNQAQYFVLGIVSYYAFAHPDWAGRFRAVTRDIAVIGLCILSYVSLRNPWPVVIWLLVMDVLLAQRLGSGSILTRFGSWVLGLPFLQWLGRISYSIYLVHIPILYAVLHLIMHLAPDLRGWSFLAAALPSTLVASVAASVITHRFIELPAIALGKRLSGERHA